MSGGGVRKILNELQTGLQASLDPVCVVDSQNKIIHINLAMKSFLNLAARDLRGTPVFCDHLKLAACEKGCQVLEALKTGETIRLDEAPASRGKEKLRVLLKVTPLRAPDGAEDSAPVVAIITLRDTTGEVLLQAKYHKIMQLLGEKDQKIATLEERLEALQASMRRARQNAA